MKEFGEPKIVTQNSKINWIESVGKVVAVGVPLTSTQPYWKFGGFP